VPVKLDREIFVGEKFRQLLATIKEELDAYDSVLIWLELIAPPDVFTSRQLQLRWRFE